MSEFSYKVIGEHHMSSGLSSHLHVRGISYRWVPDGYVFEGYTGSIRGGLDQNGYNFKLMNLSVVPLKGRPRWASIY
jgi:hypothetical protein